MHDLNRSHLLRVDFLAWRWGGLLHVCATIVFGRSLFTRRQIVLFWRVCLDSNGLLLDRYLTFLVIDIQFAQVHRTLLASHFLFAVVG